MRNTHRSFPRNPTVLVVGSWAKEQCTIENLQRNKRARVLAYIDTRNPAIIERADGFAIGKLADPDRIVSYAQEQDVDMVFITTAKPLEHGLVDRLEGRGINVFAPNRQAARLEFDKAFARNLMRKHKIDALPDFRLCRRLEDAVAFAQRHDWSVAVKPTGLTEGLGVRVSGDQLPGPKAVRDYMAQVLRMPDPGGCPRVLVEEKLTGLEFTLQCLVEGTSVVTTPAVRDFKKRLPGDNGVNTASMGSYSDTEQFLPFMTEALYDSALQIVRQTLEAVIEETGRPYRGILYGQFMITGGRLVLIEFNVRPGDPEWINTMLVLQDNVLDLALDLMQGRISVPRFEPLATVCKYVVPPAYPTKKNQPLAVTFSNAEISTLGVNTYYSCGQNGSGLLEVGEERGIAFAAKAKNIRKAERDVEKAIGCISGEFHHRFDIGKTDRIEPGIKEYGTCMTA